MRRWVYAGCLAIMVFGFTLTSCGAANLARVQQAMDARVGQWTMRDAISQWGLPTRHYQDPADGSTIATWVESQTYHAPMMQLPLGGLIAGGQPYTMRQSMTLWFDASGRLARWHYQWS